MLNIALPSFFLLLFGFFNLLGLNTSIAFTQLINITIGILVFIGIKRIGRKFFQVNSHLFYWLLVFILIATFILGIEVKGSKRWLDLYFFNFQASEFLKIFFILYFSEYLAEIIKKKGRFIDFLKFLSYSILPILIIFKQPDLGNSIVFVFIFLTLLLFSNFSKKYIIYIFFIILSFIPFFWLIMKEYQRLRLISFFSPNLDSQGNAYNMIQSVITIGSGKLFGRGLGLGTQSRLFFLPENRTDFAFASLIEQFGFVGGFLVLLLFLLIAIFLIRKIITYFYEKDNESTASFYYVLGFFAFFIFQIFINIGMNLGILPVAGIALPLISYGGSSIVTWMIGLALLP